MSLTLQVNPVMRSNLAAFGRELPASSFAELFGRIPYSVSAYSDYSGDDQSAEYEVFATYLLPLDATERLRGRLAGLRQRVGGRRLDFKGRKDAVKAAILEDWLEAFYEQPGLCVALCHDKAGHKLPGSAESNRQLRAKLAPFGISNKVAERMVRAVSYLAVVGHLLQESDRFLWVSDNDAILVGKARDELPRVLQALAIQTVGRRLERFGFCAPLAPWDKDLLSFPDLVAGTLGRCLRHGTVRGRLATPDEQSLRILACLTQFAHHTDAKVSGTRLLIIRFEADLSTKLVTPHVMRLSATPPSA